MRFVSIAAITCLAAPAMAALPPCAYDDLVRAADSVVQITVTAVTAPPGHPEQCTVSGTVAHVLAGRAEPGDPIKVTVACEWDGMVGATVYHDRAALAAAGLIELHLTGGEVAGYGAGLDILPEKAAGTMVHLFNCAPAEG